MSRHVYRRCLLIYKGFFQVDEIALFDQVSCAGFVVFHGEWFA